MKRQLCFFIAVILIILSLLPLGCDEDKTSDSGPSITTKIGYVYVPVKPETGRSGLFIGLIALEQNVPPEGYKPFSGATVSIGDTRVKTDDKGNFKISGVQPGEHQILVNAQGFQPVVQMSAVSAASTTTIAIDTMKLIPKEAIVMKGDIIQFTAVGKEPTGNFVPLSTVTWSILSEDKKEKGSISNMGVFTATDVGKVKVIAASGTYNATTDLIILDPANASTSTLTGKLSLASGSPVENATIIISGTNLMGKTDEKGNYSVLSVPSDVSLTLFAVKNGILISSAPISLEKWKEKSLDLVATSNPLPLPEEPNSVAQVTPSGSKPGSITGYVVVPIGNEKVKEVKEGLSVLQAKIVPKGYMAISGAKVMLEDDPTIYSITSATGEFTLENITYKKEGGPYFVIVSLDGYAAIRAPILFGGAYPAGIVTSIEIWPQTPVIPLGGVIEFKTVFYDRKKQIIESSKLDWAIDGDIGKIDSVNGIFTPSRVGNGTVVANYGDITERKNFTVINKEDMGKLSGMVSDKSGKSVFGAFVILENSPWVGITDENGKYEISCVPAGEKMPILIKINGKVCSNDLVSVSRGGSETKDLSVVLPPVEEVNTSDNIPDKPPSSVKTNDGNNNIGQPDKHVSNSTVDGSKKNEQGEFPRWPSDNKEQNKQESDKSPFPRWPVPTVNR